MELIGVAYRIAHIGNGKFCEFEKFRSFCHTIRHEKLLGGFPHILMKNLSEITAVKITESSDILHGYIILEVLLNKR